MIKEIVQFTKALPPETFSRNLQLKEGLYMFLDVQEENGKAVLKNVDKNGELQKEDYAVYTQRTEMTPFFEQCLKFQINSLPVSPAKIFNPNKKIYGASCSPFALSFTKKNFIKYDKRILIKELSDQYFKKAKVYVNSEEREKKLGLFRNYLIENLYELLFGLKEFEKTKDTFSVNIYSKSVDLSDFIDVHDLYLKENVFNKDDYNVRTNNGIFGISDSLSGFNDKKRFLKHQSSSLKFNYRVTADEALYLWRYFKLQQNKQLPNPCPVFVDSDELNKAVVKLHQDGQVLSHAQLVKELLRNPKDELSNFYLIYFQGGMKGSKIVDIDFVHQFKYTTDNIDLYELFDLGGNFIKNRVNDVFQLQDKIFNPVFNGKLCPKEGWIRYFDDIEPDLKYHFTDTICNLMLQYRKSIYDFIYKSRRESISCAMFDSMMKTSILEDIRIDEYKNEKHTRGYAIKEKLNLWFSLYNYFNQNQNREDMASRIPKLLEKMKEVANGDQISFSEDPAEFAFGAGQLVYFLLSKSAASNKSYAMLEPFLQKTKVSQLQDTIGNTIAIYKHEIDVSKGRFEKLASEVLAYESDINMKEYLRYFLAGCFAQSVIYEKKEKKQSELAI
jgi:CRISPR-associated protein Csh1